MCPIYRGPIRNSSWLTVQSLSPGDLYVKYLLRVLCVTCWHLYHLASYIYIYTYIHFLLAVLYDMLWSLSPDVLYMEDLVVFIYYSCWGLHHQASICVCVYKIYVGMCYKFYMTSTGISVSTSIYPQLVSLLPGISYREDLLHVLYECS